MVHTEDPKPISPPTFDTNCEEVIAYSSFNYGLKMCTSSACLNEDIVFALSVKSALLVGRTYA